MPFEESMIKWDPNDGLAEKLEQAGPWAPFWETCLQVDGFVQSTPAAATAVTDELPAEVLQCIDECKVWHEKLLAVAHRF